MFKVLWSRWNILVWAQKLQYVRLNKHLENSLGPNIFGLQKNMFKDPNQTIYSAYGAKDFVYWSVELNARRKRCEEGPISKKKIVDVDHSKREMYLYALETERKLTISVGPILSHRRSYQTTRISNFYLNRSTHSNLY